jgi:hypothetical protein
VSVTVTFGKHKGKLEQVLVIRWPDYVSWVLSQPQPSGPMIPLATKFKALIEAFDRKPILKKCFRCKEPATRYSLYRNSVNAYWWCDACDPYSSGAIEGRLTIGRTYREALRHVQYSCGDTATEARTVIRMLAEAKGLPRRMNEAAALKFFS